MSKNDERILKLKEQIAEKKSAIGKAKRFAPTTSCSIELDGLRYNLHAATREQLVFLACKLDALATSAKSLGLSGECVVSGFTVEDWLGDIKSRIAVLAQKDEEHKLQAMEAKLTKLLSNDKKTELELDEIASLLE